MARCACKGGQVGSCKHIALCMYSLEDLLKNRGSVTTGPCQWVKRPTSETEPCDIKHFIANYPGLVSSILHSGNSRGFTQGTQEVSILFIARSYAFSTWLRQMFPVLTTLNLTILHLLFCTIRHQKGLGGLYLVFIMLRGLYHGKISTM